MARQSAKFQCQQCATVLNKWAGQCPECHSWNSIQEIQPVSSGTASRANWAEHKTTSEVVTLQQLPDTDTLRFSSQIDELDRVLGGGLVHGVVARDANGIAIELGIQIGTLGITVASLLIAGGGLTEYALPSAIHGITMYLVTIPVVLLLRRRT